MKHFLKRFPFAISVIFLLSCQSTPKTIQNIHRLSLNDPQYLERMKAQEHSFNIPKHSEIAYLLYDPLTGTTVDGKNENLPLIPASTTKVLTSFAALKILGSNFKFKTKLAYRGKIANHQLIGDLYLKGEGDPSFSVSHLKDLVRSLSDHQITSIKGHFYFDDSEISSHTSINTLNEYSASHNPGISALSIDFNQLYLHWSPTPKTPLDADLVTIPDLSIFDVKLSDHSETSPSPFRLENHETTENWSMSRKQVLSGQKRLPIRHPSLATALLFSNFCKMSGIQLPTPEPGVLTKVHSTLAIHESAPLVEIVDRALEYSNNLMSELILLALAKKLAGHPVDTKTAANLMKEWITLHTKLPDPDKLELFNGSGLTSKNRVTPFQFVTILNTVDHENFGNRKFESLLPISGWKGTLSHRLTLPESAFHVWAKTGTLNNANALTGYIYTLQGRRLIFAILIADLKDREKLDEFTDGIPNELEISTRAWNKHVRLAEDALLQKWILNY